MTWIRRHSVTLEIVGMQSVTIPLSGDRRWTPLLDAGLAIVVFAASLGFLAAGQHSDDAETFGVVAVVLTALASLPVVAVRRAPLAVFVITALASIALRAVANPDGPPLGATVALFMVAYRAEGPPERTRLTLAVVVTMLFAHLTAVGISQDHFPGAELVFAVVLWGGTWLAGDRARLRAERIAALEERALQAERAAERERRLATAEERMRIARDLHDSAGHAVNVILVHAGAGRMHLDRDPAAAHEAFATIEQVARETVDEIDQLVGALREDGSGSSEVEPPPGFAALEGLIERHRAAGLDVTLRYRGAQRALAPAVDRSLFRILQEALTNATRHGAGSAQVELAFGETAIELRVENPVGLQRLVREGHGLVGMRERAALLGGSLDTSETDGRFRLVTRLPYAAQT
jgi:signal transduction histidine kinase